MGVQTMGSLGVIIHSRDECLSRQCSDTIEVYVLVFCFGYAHIILEG